MKSLCLPSIGDTLQLACDWTAVVSLETCNYRLLTRFYQLEDTSAATATTTAQYEQLRMLMGLGHPKPDAELAVGIAIPAGTKLVVDRIYVGRTAETSTVTFRLPINQLHFHGRMVVSFTNANEIVYE